MDLRVYYRKLREVEASISDAEVVIVSRETADGGVPGVVTEAPRAVAAKLLVEGRARLASDEESAQHREKAREAAAAAEQAAQARRVQIAVLSEADVRALKNSSKRT